MLRFLQIKSPPKLGVMDESFPAKCFKSNKMINCSTFGSGATLHFSEQIVGFKVRDKFTDDHSFQGFTDVVVIRKI